MDGIKVKAGLGAGTGSILAILYSLDPDKFMGLLNSTLEHQVVSFTLAFTLAAWIHSGRVKNEIKNQFRELVDGLDRLGEKLESRIEVVENTVSKINNRVEALEKPKGK